MKFGVRLPTTGPLASPENIVRIGSAAEELGFDAVTAHDHVSTGYGNRYHNAGGMAEMVDEMDRKGLPVNNIYEAMTALSFVAGRTRRVRLIPTSAVLPWRHPVLFAKQAVTLHELSGGRLVCCVVIGNIESDFRAMGVDFRKRGRMMDEDLEILGLVFSGKGPSKFEGEFHSFGESEFLPKPTEKLPIWLGGSFSEVVMGRVARYGDGFLAGTVFPEGVRDGIVAMKEYLRAHGRDPGKVEFGSQTFMCLMNDASEARRRSRLTIESFFHGPEFDAPDPKNPSKTVRETRVEGTVKAALVGSPDELIAKIEQFAAVGIQFLDIRQVNASLEEVLAQMKLFSSEVAPSFE